MLRNFYVICLLFVGFMNCAWAHPIYVIGSGNVGTFFSLALSRYHDVKIITGGKTTTRQIEVSQDPDNKFRPEKLNVSQNLLSWDDAPTTLEKDSIVLIAVKGKDLKTVGEKLAKKLDKTQTLIFLQNGFDVMNESPDLKDYAKKMRALVVFGINLSRSENVSTLKVTADPKVILGSELKSPSLDEIASLFTQSGVAIFGKGSNIREIEWRKSIHNIYTNGLTALCNLKIGGIIENPNTLRVANELLNEAATVARFEKVEFLETHLDLVRNMAKGMANHSTTMNVDLKNGQKTENQWLYGHLVKVAKEAGISIPFTEELYHSIIKAENGTPQTQHRFCVAN